MLRGLKDQNSKKKDAFGVKYGRGPYSDIVRECSCCGSRSCICGMDSIATDDDMPVAETPIDREKQDQPPSDRPKEGEEVNTARSSKNTGNVNVRTEDTQSLKSKALEVVGEDGEVAVSFATDEGLPGRPKRNATPSAKAIENRIQYYRAKLEKLWGNVINAIGELQETPDSLEELRSGIAKVRSNFHDYQVVWLSYVDFLAFIGTPECQQERETLEDIMDNQNQFVQTTITQGNERKKELLLEMGSLRSSSRASSTSSAAVLAQAKAEAAAAMKKVEMQKKRSLVESQSALLIQQEELALARRKMDEQVKIEGLRLEEEGAIAVAKANAIDDELGFKSGAEAHRVHLPAENASQRVQHYIENRCI